MRLRLEGTPLVPCSTEGVLPATAAVLTARQQRLSRLSRRMLRLNTIVCVCAITAYQLSRAGMLAGIPPEAALWGIFLGVVINYALVCVMFVDRSERLARRAWARAWAEIAAADLAHPRFHRARARALRVAGPEHAEVLLALAPEFPGTAGELLEAARACCASAAAPADSFPA